MNVIYDGTELVVHGGLPEASESPPVTVAGERRGQAVATLGRPHCQDLDSLVQRAQRARAAVLLVVASGSVDPWRAPGPESAVARP